MPWIEASLRGQRVLARAKTDGSLDADGGRVEIRYKPNDGRAYRAAAGNLAVTPGAALLPDDTCAPGEPVAPPDKAGAPSPRGAAEDGAAPRAKTAGGSKRSAPSLGPLPAGSWIAYTDGACSGNPGPAGSGFVVIAPGGKIAEGFEWLGTATNNVAELTGILRALEVIPEDAPYVVVHTDSKYAIGVLTQGWKAKVNQALIERTRAVLAKRGKNVRVVYVPGHSGVPMNERADELAREAISRRSTQTIALG